MSDARVEGLDRAVASIRARCWVPVVWGRRIWACSDTLNPSGWNRWIVYTTDSRGSLYPEPPDEWWWGIWRDPRSTAWRPGPLPTGLNKARRTDPGDLPWVFSPHRIRLHRMNHGVPCPVWLMTTFFPNGVGHWFSALSERGCTRPGECGTGP